MAAVTVAQWLAVAGMGAMWLGAQRLDQYSFIGITLTIVGPALICWGVSR